MDEQTRVLIADDQPKVMLGLRLLLEREKGVVIVGEASEMSGLIDLVVQKSPHLLLLDWGLAGTGSVKLLPKLRKICSNMKVIVLSGRPEVQNIALAAGADAFVSMADPPEILLDVLCKTRNSTPINSIETRE